MSRVKTLQNLFKRYRRPGDIVFAWLFLVISLALLSQLVEQTAYKPGGKLFAQPRFWPAVSLIGMFVFAALHLVGSICSERIRGRRREILLWFSAVEYAVWFIAYATCVPIVGYLPATVIVALLLTFRVGYRNWLTITIAGLFAVAAVLVFKTFLQVKLPSGLVYEWLPNGLRQIMLAYF